MRLVICPKYTEHHDAQHRAPRSLPTCFINSSARIFSLDQSEAGERERKMSVAAIRMRP